MRRLLAVLSLLLVHVTAASAAPPPYVELGPEGGSMTDIARDPANPQHVWLLGSRLWQSLDGGGHWSADPAAARRAGRAAPCGASRPALTRSTCTATSTSTAGAAPVPGAS